MNKGHRYLYMDKATPSDNDISLDGHTYSQINIKDEDDNLILHTFDIWSLDNVSVDIKDGKIRIVPNWECELVIDEDTHSIYSKPTINKEEYMKNLVSTLNRRVERFNEEVNIQAPSLVTLNELRLIAKACDDLSKLIQDIEEQY